MAHRRLPPGCRWWKGSVQAYVTVNRRRVSKSFPPDTDSPTLLAWRVHQQLAAARPARGSFADDVAAYLTRIRAHPSYPEIARHLTLWVNALGGNRSRASIHAGEIDAVLQDWLRTGLAGDTVRKRRAMLLAMWNRLDGKGAPNPVRESHAPPPARPEIRTLDYVTIVQLLDGMPRSKTRARLTVMAWTGLPAAQIRLLAPADVDLERATVRVAPRRKGRGAEARVLPLLPQAVKAFREFAQVGAWGSFTGAPLAQSFRRACKRVGVTGARPYDLRHAFGALLYEATHDQATVGRLLLHASPAMTARYVSASASTVDQAAITTAGKLARRKVSRRVSSSAVARPDARLRP